MLSPEFWRLLCRDAMCFASRSCKLNIWPQMGQTNATSEPGGISSTTGCTSRLYLEATDSLVVGDATSPLTTGTWTAPAVERGGRKPDGVIVCMGVCIRPRRRVFNDKSNGNSCGLGASGSNLPVDIVSGWGQPIGALARSALAVNQSGRSESEWLRRRKMSGRYLV